jgi:hypothetical protein
MFADIGIDNPKCFETELTLDQQKALTDWINGNFLKIQSFNFRHSSYDLKHKFEKSENGFYMGNGAFKGAMLRCGFKVKDESTQNWTFNVSEKSPALVK